MIKLTDIESAAREFSIKSKKLRNFHEELNNEIDTVKSKHIENIKQASIEAGESYQMLLTLVGDAPDLFKDKKSMTVSGVKFGYQKKKGKLDIINEDNTINKIKELYGDNSSLYINTKLSVIKKALDSIPASDLKKLGVNIIQDTDTAFVKLTDDEVQKLIEAMVKESAKVSE